MQYDKEMGEAEFIARVCDAADCKLMLDVNNAWVNATNFRFDVDTCEAHQTTDGSVPLAPFQPGMDEHDRTGGAVTRITNGRDERRRGSRRAHRTLAPRATPGRLPG